MRPRSPQSRCRAAGGAECAVRAPTPLCSCPSPRPPLPRGGRRGAGRPGARRVAPTARAPGSHRSRRRWPPPRRRGAAQADAVARTTRTLHAPVRQCRARAPSRGRQSRRPSTLSRRRRCSACRTRRGSTRRPCHSHTHRSRQSRRRAALPSSERSSCAGKAQSPGTVAQQRQSGTGTPPQPRLRSGFGLAGTRRRPHPLHLPRQAQPRFRIPPLRHEAAPQRPRCAA
mmetsp:Transcript_132377/g.369020  ORF Transcript_132377/g.369020 Transcript_132377/m.369020 type:complete len:228 (-) Transcript_132377:934-1617(-)